MVSWGAAEASERSGFWRAARSPTAQTHADASASLGGCAFPHADAAQGSSADSAQRSSHATYESRGQPAKTTYPCGNMSSLAAAAAAGAREAESPTASEFRIFRHACSMFPINNWFILLILYHGFNNMGLYIGFYLHCCFSPFFPLFLNFRAP